MLRLQILFAAVEVAAIFFVYSVYGQLIPGPTDIIRDEGSNNVPINCPFSAPIWRINSTLYEPLSLQPPLSANAIGINIEILDKSINNTQFQCFLPNGTGLYVHKSTIGTITVTKVGGYHPPQIKSEGRIILDHRRFNFNATHKTIAWKFANNQSCTSTVVFTINSSTVNVRDPVHSWTTQTYDLTLSSSDFVGSNNELLYFSISANDKNEKNCSGQSVYFQVPLEAYTNEVSIALGDDGCLEVPKIPEIQSLYAVWPNGDSTDCICPLCDDSDCTLHSCECYNSTFAPELQLRSGTSLIGNYTLCWPRLSSDQNNSEVYFFFEVSNSSSDLSLINRVYGNNNNFVVRGPPLPPSLNDTGTELCFNSYSYFPIDSFFVEIIDISGEKQTLNEPAQQPQVGCIPISEEYFPCNCTPFNVIVRAHNKVGNSTAATTNMTLQENYKEDVCACMTQKIDVDINIQTKSRPDINMQINCTKLTLSKVQLFIKLSSNIAFKNQTVHLTCSTSTTIDISKLDPNTEYRVSILYVLESVPSIECFQTSFVTPPATNPKTGSYVLIAISAVLTIVVVTTFFVLCVRKMKQLHDTNPEKEHLIPTKDERGSERRVTAPEPVLQDHDLPTEQPPHEESPEHEEQSHIKEEPQSSKGEGHTEVEEVPQSGEQPTDANTSREELSMSAHGERSQHIGFHESLPQTHASQLKSAINQNNADASADENEPENNAFSSVFIHDNTKRY